MFPEVDISVYRGTTVNDVIDLVLGERKAQEVSQPVEKTAIDIFAADLHRHALDFFGEADADYMLQANRSCIYNVAEGFYKSACQRESLLRNNLQIKFSGEDGIDAGALRTEFFGAFLCEADHRY